MTLEFSLLIFKIPSIPNFVKIHLVGAKLFQADRQTDMTELKVALRNFANAPKELMILVSTRHARVVIGTMDAFPVACHPRAAQVHVGFQHPDARVGHF
jgi:hypothetical protein